MGSIIADPNQNIYSLLKNFAAHDSFMSKLIEVSGKFNALEKKQDIHMCILRSDYMIDQPTRELKLVEYNTIASSFGCLSQKVRNLHHYLADKYAPELKFNYKLPI